MKTGTAALCLALAACSGSTNERRDAFPHLEAGVMPDAGPGPAAPKPPAPPAFADWTCPVGWRSAPGFTDVKGKASPPKGVKPFLICEPPPQLACADGTVQWLGRRSCAPIGTACPDKLFLEEAAIRKLAPANGGKLLFVAPGAEDGEGSRSHPLGTVAAAMKAAAAKDVVVLSRGLFKEAVTFTKDVAVVGACVAKTTLAAPTVDGAAPIVSFVGKGGRLANLRVTGQRSGIEASKKGAVATVHRVEVLRSMRNGVAVSDEAALQLTEVVVRDTRSLSVSATIGGVNWVPKELGIGVRVVGGQLAASHLVVEGNRFSGIVVWPRDKAPAPSVKLADVVVRDTRCQELDQLYGEGLYALNGAKVTVERALLERNRNYGVLLGAWSGRPAPTVGLTDLVVRDTTSQESDKKNGFGLSSHGSQLTVQRAVFQRNRRTGLFVYGKSKSGVKLSDLVIRDTRTQESDRMTGYGLGIFDDATLTAERVVIERNQSVGVLAMTEFGLPPTATLRHIVVRDTRSEEKNKYLGIGLMMLKGAKLSVERAIVERNRYVGVYLEAMANGPTAAKLSDIVVRDTKALESDLTGGNGVLAFNGADLTMERATVERNRQGGISMVSAKGFPGSVATLRDITVRDTQSRRSDKRGGRGIVAGDGAKLTLERALLERNRDIGFLAMAEKGRTAVTAKLKDLVVRDTRRADCAGVAAGKPDSCVSGSVVAGGGTALSVLNANATIDSFDISGSLLCGIQIVGSGLINASHGYVHHNAIGFNVQVSSYKYETVLSDTVRFRYNDTNLDSNELPVPETSKLTPWKRKKK